MWFKISIFEKYLTRKKKKKKNLWKIWNSINYPIISMILYTYSKSPLPFWIFFSREHFSQFPIPIFQIFTFLGYHKNLTKKEKAYQNPHFPSPPPLACTSFLTFQYPITTAVSSKSAISNLAPFHKPLAVAWPLTHQVIFAPTTVGNSVYFTAFFLEGFRPKWGFFSILWHWFSLPIIPF